MKVWQAEDAQAHFSELLDRAEIEGPQIVQRGDQHFLVMTEETYHNLNLGDTVAAE